VGAQHPQDHSASHRGRPTGPLLAGRQPPQVSHPVGEVPPTCAGDDTALLAAALTCCEGEGGVGSLLTSGDSSGEVGHPTSPFFCLQCGWYSRCNMQGAMPGKCEPGKRARLPFTDYPGRKVRRQPKPNEREIPPCPTFPSRPTTSSLSSSRSTRRTRSHTRRPR